MFFAPIPQGETPGGLFTGGEGKPQVVYLLAAGRSGIPRGNPRAVHGAVSRELSARISAHIQSAPPLLDADWI